MSLAKFALSKLAKRYSASQTSIKARAEYLEIDPDNVTEEDLLKLDALDRHLEGGGSLLSFKYTPVAEVEVISTESAIVSQRPPDPEPEPDIEIPSASLDLESLERIYEFLQKAVDHKWHLPTSVIRAITGSTPRGRRWKRYGFEFEMATRHGSERAWAVSLASWDFGD